MLPSAGWLGRTHTGEARDERSDITKHGGTLNYYRTTGMPSWCADGLGGTPRRRWCPACDAAEQASSPRISKCRCTQGKNALCNGAADSTKNVSGKSADMDVELQKLFEKTKYLTKVCNALIRKPQPTPLTRFVGGAPLKEDIEAQDAKIIRKQRRN